ncbi:hypothetical protein FQZ97_1060930 [compost metagenome]
MSIFETLVLVSFSCDMFTASLSASPRATLVIFVPPVLVTELYVSPVIVTVLCVLLSYFTASAVEFFNCATLTASVSTVPAAKSVIWRVLLLTASPRLKAPCVLFQAAPVLVEAVLVNGS